MSNRYTPPQILPPLLRTPAPPTVICQAHLHWLLYGRILDCPIQIHHHIRDGPSHQLGVFPTHQQSSQMNNSESEDVKIITISTLVKQEHVATCTKRN